MQVVVMRFPVVCPQCAQESLVEFPATFIDAALAAGETIRLAAHCHDLMWDAGYLEREQFQEYCEAQRFAAAHPLTSADLPPSDPYNCAD